MPEPVTVPRFNLMQFVQLVGDPSRVRIVARSGFPDRDSVWWYSVRRPGGAVDLVPESALEPEP